MLQLVKIATARVVGCADGGKAVPSPCLVLGHRSVHCHVSVINTVGWCVQESD